MRFSVNQLGDTIRLTGHIYLKTVQKVMVRMTKAQFHSWSSWMVATPRNMKMIVSEELFAQCEGVQYRVTHLVGENLLLT